MGALRRKQNRSLYFDFADITRLNLSKAAPRLTQTHLRKLTKSNPKRNDDCFEGAHSFAAFNLKQRPEHRIGVALMFYHYQTLINPIVDDEPDPSAANALQEGLGGQFGEMRTMMQYLFQSFNFRGDGKALHGLDPRHCIEEISHVELISKTISKLLDGAPEYHGKRFDTPGKGGKATMDMAKEQQNPHHFIVGAQGSMPVDAAGNPWSGSYVHCNGNLVLDLLDNLVLESTGRLQKCRHLSDVYEQDSTCNSRVSDCQR